MAFRGADDRATTAYFWLFFGSRLRHWQSEVFESKNRQVAAQDVVVVVVVVVVGGAGGGRAGGGWRAGEWVWVAAAIGAGNRRMQTKWYKSSRILVVVLVGMKFDAPQSKDRHFDPRSRLEVATVTTQPAESVEAAAPAPPAAAISDNAASNKLQRAGWPRIASASVELRAQKSGGKQLGSVRGGTCGIRKV